MILTWVIIVAVSRQIKNQKKLISDVYKVELHRYIVILNCDITVGIVWGDRTTNGGLKHLNQVLIKI